MELKKLFLRYFNNKLFTDSFWALSGNVVLRGLGLIGAIMVARFLGKDIYGEYGMIRNTLLSIAILSTFGLGYTATNFVAENRIKRTYDDSLLLSYTNFITLATSGLFAILLLVFSQFIAKNILDAPHLSDPLRIVSVWIVFSALTTSQIGVLAGLGEFKAMAKINAISGVLTFILTVVLTYLYNLTGAIFALLIAQIINWYLNHRLVKANIPYKITFRYDPLLKRLLDFSFPIALQEALYSMSSWLTYIILIKITNYGELGIYTAASQWGAVVLFVPGILRNVILSHLSSNNSNEQEHNLLLKRMLLINLIATTAPFIIILLFSSFISRFYGSSFGGLQVVLIVCVLTTIFMSLSNVYVQALMSKAKNWKVFYFKLFRDLGIVISTFLFLMNNNRNGALVLSLITLFMNIGFLALIYLTYPKTSINN
ncbi:oligosaccharide flippase family protein [Pedobacter steynii]